MKVATSLIDLPAWARQALQQREVYGVVLKSGQPGQAYDENTMFAPAGPPGGSQPGIPTGAAAVGGPAGDDGNIQWNTSNYGGQQLFTFPASPIRRFLLIENLSPASPANPLWVSFGQSVIIGSQGHVLTTFGSVLYVDRECPRNAFYVQGVAAFFAVTQGNIAV